MSKGNEPALVEAVLQAMVRRSDEYSLDRGPQRTRSLHIAANILYLVEHSSDEKIVELAEYFAANGKRDAEVFAAALDKDGQGNG